MGFDGSTLNWFLAKEKAEKVMRRCWNTICSSHASLEQIQKLMGSINDLAQMCPLLKFHKRSGNALIRKFRGKNNIVLMVTDELRKDLALITKVATVIAPLEACRLPTALNILCQRPFHATLM